MNSEEMKKLNKEFYDQTEEMYKEFMDVFNKWKVKNIRLTTVNSIHFSINILMNLINSDKENIMSQAIPDLPQIFERFLKPFEKIADKWGEVSSEEFAKLYEVEYGKQFDAFFETEEDKVNFKKWFENENGSK